MVPIPGELQQEDVGGCLPLHSEKLCSKYTLAFTRQCSVDTISQASNGRREMWTKAAAVSGSLHSVYIRDVWDPHWRRLGKSLLETHVAGDESIAGIYLGYET